MSTNNELLQYARLRIYSQLRQLPVSVQGFELSSWPMFSSKSTNIDPNVKIDIDNMIWLVNIY